MQKALWNGKIVYAYKIAEDYELEKAARIASPKKEFLCTDEECKCRVLKYCNGDEKKPYFAHRENSNCDYARFEKNYGIMERLTVRLAEILEKNGYKVQIHERLFKGHITYLVVWQGNANPVAVDFITHRIGVNDIEGWASAYRHSGMQYSFIVADKNLDINEEKNTFFAKRYSLNETKNRFLICISWDGKTVTQIAMDRKNYSYKERLCNFSPELSYSYYKEVEKAENIIIEDDQLSIKGFFERYQSWKETRNSFYENWKSKVDDEILLAQKQKEEAEAAREVAKREAERKEAERVEAEKEAKLAREAKRQAKLESDKENNPKLSRVFEIFRNHRILDGRFSYKDSKGYSARRLMDKGYLDVSCDYGKGTIKIELEDYTYVSIFINEHGGEEKKDNSGCYFMNIDLTQIDMDEIEMQLGGYISLK